MERKEILEKPYENGCVFLFFDDFTKNEWLMLHRIPDYLKNKWFDRSETSAIRVLSVFGDTLEAASKLFETLHELDSGNFKRIFAQFAPTDGLGEAINDRLTRASG